MSTKTKNINTFQNVSSNLATAGQNLGVVVMAAATMFGLVEVSNHQMLRGAVAVQPAFSIADFSNTPKEEGSTQRREREESGPHYVSYGISQRTPGRTGRQ